MTYLTWRAIVVAAPEETRENREFWIRQTTALLAMYINGYLYISLYCYHRVSSGSAESGARRDQNGARVVFTLAQTLYVGYH